MPLSLESIIEALLIAAEEPLTLNDIQRVLKQEASRQLSEEEPSDAECKILRSLALAKSTSIQEAIDTLNATYLKEGRSFSILNKSSGWKIYTKSDFGDFVAQLYPNQRSSKLSKAAIETLAIIAYRQPITKASMEATRGVSCDGMIQKLLNRDLISITGRANQPGRPLLYATTPEFFEHFGIKSIEELPNFEELRKQEIPDSALTEETSDQNQLEFEPA